MTLDMPLKHCLLTILSLAASRGQNRIPMKFFYQIFADLSAKFPDVLPGLDANRTPFYAYSRQLDGALQALIGFGVNIPSPDFWGIEISSPTAEHFIRRLEDSYGSEAIEDFRVIAEEFINRFKRYSGT
jgi:hypothetical protein